MLNKLREAGAKGLNKAGLGIGSSTSGKQAVNELESEGKIANLESGNKFLYVLKAFDMPLEMACERIEAETASRKNTLLNRTKLIGECKKRCPGRVKKELEKAVDWLVKENRLLKFKYKNFFVFLHASAVQTAEALPELNRDRVSEAYRKVSQRAGFSNVEIYQLQQELGAPMDALKAFLLEESRHGRAVLSLGDWSLSSEETRSGAVELQGSQYLLVRFKDA